MTNQRPLTEQAARYVLGYNAHTELVHASRQAVRYAQQVLDHIVNHGRIPDWLTSDPDVAAAVAQHLKKEADATNPLVNPDAGYRNPPGAVYGRLQRGHGPQVIAAIKTCHDLRRLLVAELDTQSGQIAAEMIDGYADGLIMGAEGG